MILKLLAAIYLKMICRHSPEGTEEIHDKPESGWTAFRVRFNSGAF
jgi:hypothetical protein